MEQVTETAIVHVIDDHAEFRESVLELLKSVGLTVREHAAAEEFLESYDPSVPGCVIADVCMPGMSGLHLQERLIENRMTIPVIILSGHADVSMAVQAMSKGALAFLEKPCRNHEFLELVKDAVRRDRANRQRERRQRDVLARFDRLTRREFEVMERLARGEGNKQVAAALQISERTVESHRASIMEKLEAGSLAQFLELVIERRAICQSGEGMSSP
jgi:FixJ family two-component response regulator